MAGSLSRAFWARSAACSPTSDDSQKPPWSAARDSIARAAWRSPTVDRRVAGDNSPPPPTTVLPSSAAGRRSAAVRFTTSAFRLTNAIPRLHRPWRAATPFRPNHAAATLSPDITEVHMPSVDMGPSSRLAYAFVHPPCADPGNFIRVALRKHGGDQGLPYR
nr:unnamed protein product [Digitaria exilis]